MLLMGSLIVVHAYDPHRLYGIRHAKVLHDVCHCNTVIGNCKVIKQTGYLHIHRHSGMSQHTRMRV